MSALRGITAGVLGLSLLEVLVATPAASKNAGSLVTLVTKAMNRLVDPSVALIPDLRSY